MNEYKRYKNGDRCPYCGQVLEGKSEDWLELFSFSVGLWLGEANIYPLSGEGDEEGTGHDEPEV